jgi:hypothetical protein
VVKVLFYIVLVLFLTGCTTVTITTPSKNTKLKVCAKTLLEEKCSD